MFSNKTKDSELAPAPAAPTAKRVARAAAPSIISADLLVNGTLISAGDIQIDGRVEGDVRAANLVIGDKAEIEGEVVAEDVTIRGKIHGSIRARKVHLAATCHVEGNILHEAFAVESGAFFEGNCRHSSDPLSDEGRKAVAFELKASAAASPSPSVRAVDTAPRAVAASVSPMSSGA